MLAFTVNPRRFMWEEILEIMFKTDKGFIYTTVRENEPTLLSREE
jgi:hypothetical protein